MATASLVSVRISKSWVAPYVMAFLGTVAALFIRSALNPFLGNYVPYVTLFPAIAFCAWYCGIGPSIVCIALSLSGRSIGSSRLSSSQASWCSRLACSCSC